MKTILLKSLFAFLVLILIASLALCAICYETMRRYDGRRTAGLLPPAGEFLYPEKRGVTFAVFGDFRMQLDPFRELDGQNPRRQAGFHAECRRHVRGALHPALQLDG